MRQRLSKMGAAAAAAKRDRLLRIAASNVATLISAR
jgi:hypothetical protein